jgi:hypothetical protein
MLRMIKVVMMLVLVSLAFVGCSEKKVTLAEDFLSKSHQAVKDAYGENYIPSMNIDTMYLSEIYKLDMDLVEEVIAEGPMMSMHIDTFIGVRAKAGKVEDVKKALEDYRLDAIANSFQYPMNMAKLNASTVYSIGDYVYFLMLGGFDETPEQTEEGALSFAKEQVEVAIKAIEAAAK